MEDNYRQPCKSLNNRKMRRVTTEYRNTELEEAEEELEEEQSDRRHAMAMACRSRTEHAHPLTEDVEGTLSNILERIPVQKMFQMMKVCKLWHSLLKSDIFVQRWEQKHHRWVIAARVTAEDAHSARIELLAYDDAASSWTTNLSSVHVMKHRAGNPNFCKLQHGNDWLHSVPRLSNLRMPMKERLLVATCSRSATGLLCFVYKQNMDAKLTVNYSLLVLNPLTNFHALLALPFDASHDMYLPPMSNPWRRRHLYLEADDDGPLPLRHCEVQQHYRIFVFDEPTAGLYIYSSWDRSWRLACCPCTAISISRSIPASRLIPAELYDEGCAVDFVFWLKDRQLVLAYSSRIDRWEMIEATEAVRIAKARRCIEGGVLVFKHGRRVLMAVVKAKEPENGGIAGFCIYEMRRKKSGSGFAAISAVNVSTEGTLSCNWDWVRIASTPEHLWRGLYEARHLDDLQTNLVYAGGMVCLTAFHHQPSFLDLEFDVPPNTSLPLTYDIDADSWQYLPYPAPTTNCKNLRDNSPPPLSVLDQCSAQSLNLSPPRAPPPLFPPNLFVVCSMKPSFSASPWP